MSHSAPYRLRASMIVAACVVFVASLFTNTSLYRLFIRRLIVLVMFGLIAMIILLTLDLWSCLHGGICR